MHRHRQIDRLKLVCFILIIALASSNVVSAPASDEQMANDTLAPHVSRDPDKRDRVLRELFDELAEVASQNPDSVRVATIFFSTGLSYRELADLRRSFGIEVIDMTLKAAQGDKGVVMSILSGMADFIGIDGTFEEQLSFVMAVRQECFAKMSRYMPPDEASGMAELATKPFRVYGARIFGPNRSLRELQQQPTVRSVMLHSTNGLITSYEYVKSSGGPNPHLMPGFLC